MSDLNGSNCEEDQLIQIILELNLMTCRKNNRLSDEERHILSEIGSKLEYFVEKMNRNMMPRQAVRLVSSLSSLASSVANLASNDLSECIEEHNGKVLTEIYGLENANLIDTLGTQVRTLG